MAGRRTTPGTEPPAVVKKAVRKPRARVRDVRPDDVAVRAYHLSLHQPEASPEENWLRAEHELLAS